MPKRKTISGQMLANVRDAIQISRIVKDNVYFRLNNEPYIIGGQDADEGEYPFQVIIGRQFFFNS